MSAEKVIDLDAIRALEAGATAGPWWVTEDLDPNDDESAIGVAAGPSEDPAGMVVVTPGSGSFDIGIGLDRRLPNAEFIAAARTAVPDLLALLDEALAVVVEATEAPGRLDDGEIHCTFCFRVFERPIQPHEPDCTVTRAAALLARFPVPSPTEEETT